MPAFSKILSGLMPVSSIHFSLCLNTAVCFFELGGSNPLSSLMTCQLYTSTEDSQMKAETWTDYKIEKNYLTLFIQ